MNAIHFARKFEKDAKAAADHLFETANLDENMNVKHPIGTPEYTALYTRIYDQQISIGKTRFMRTADLAGELHALGREVFQRKKQQLIQGTPEEPTKGVYSLIIRPREMYNHPWELYTQAKKIVAKPWCLECIMYTLEQTGDDPEIYGQGCHLNMIIRVKHRSIGEFKRALMPIIRYRTENETWNIEESGIDIRPLRTQGDIDRMKLYLTDYVSADGHKERMSDHDRAWRSDLNMPHVFNAQTGWALPAELAPVTDEQLREAGIVPGYIVSESEEEEPHREPEELIRSINLNQ